MPEAVVETRRVEYASALVRHHDSERKKTMRHDRSLLVASLVFATLLGASARGLALDGDGDGCCGACEKKSGDGSAVAKKLDAAIEDWGKVPADFQSMSNETRARIARSTAVMRETNPGFALMPATLHVAQQLIDAARPACCVAKGGDASVAAKTSALFAASLRGLASSSAKAGESEGACCSLDGAAPTTDALVKEADLLLEKWAAASKVVAALSPESRAKLGEARAFAGANCPIGKRMAGAFALGQEALAAAVADEEKAGSPDRAALVKKAAALIDAARSTLQ
jgi:hypothetical protein